MPYICVTRTDIPNGVLQVLDLWPHTSQRNQVIDPEGQTRYLRGPVTDTVALSSFATVEAYEGLAAYLLDNVVSGGLAAGTGALTAADANDAAAAVVALMQAGSALTLTAVNAAIAGVVADTALSTGSSTGTLADLLKILSGGLYVVPAGTLVEDTGVKEPAGGSFDDTYWKPVVQSGAFEISRLRGNLSKLKSADFTYRGVTGAAVAVYGDDGSVL